jgi:hypothetical protein
MRILIVTLLSLIPFSLYATARSESGGLAERVFELEAQVEELSAILEFVYIETEKINGLRGPHVIIEGANLHVRSGQGMTGFPVCPGPCPELKSGLGNLIVGYNELPFLEAPKRGGMHNLIVGQEHEYFGTGNFVAGRHNSVGGPNASVAGGRDNQAHGTWSSVSGGLENVASSGGASVSGGRGNVASGPVATVSGGEGRVAPGRHNWAAGELFEEN